MGNEEGHYQSALQIPTNSDATPVSLVQLDFQVKDMAHNWYSHKVKVQSSKMQ